MIGKNQLDALIKLFGGDADAAKRWLTENVDATNREIAERGMIARQVKPQEQPAPLELDDTAIAEIVKRVAPALGVSKSEIATIREQANAIASAIAERDTQIAKLQAAIDALVKSLESAVTRLTKLERDEDDKKREWIEDLPPVSATRKVTYRPRLDAETEIEPDMTSQANASLAKLPEYKFAARK